MKTHVIKIQSNDSGFDHAEIYVRYQDVLDIIKDIDTMLMEIYHSWKDKGDEAAAERNLIKAIGTDYVKNELNSRVLVELTEFD